MSFRVGADMRAKLEALAAADRRTLSQYVMLVLAEHIEAKEAATKASGSRKKPGAKG